MNDPRTFLEPGTRIKLDTGSIYEICGAPIGSGGGSILYPARRLWYDQGIYKKDGSLFAIKECFPLSRMYRFLRNEQGKIVPETDMPQAQQYLQRVKQMQAAEQQITQEIYLTGSRLLPVLESANQLLLTRPDMPEATVKNTITVMESLSSKGRSLDSYLKEYRRITPARTFHIIQQVLFALREIHNSGYLHLDIQTCNIFLKGALEDGSDITTLIDFSSARKLYHGKTNPIVDCVIFSTDGFTAPEIRYHNDGTLQLGPEADLYSVGCLILCLLTGQLYDPDAWVRTSDGLYLTPRKLRHIHCPKHLIPRLQQIIVRALAEDPANRYPSAEEMLTDVTAFLEALTPYRSDLAGVSYDAFICYKHGPIDTPAAKKLQENLEHFHAPRGISEKRIPFEKVFVDEGELSGSAHYEEDLKAALKNSGWLIVICSPDTPSSPWVSKEINEFLKYHDRSRILAVITGGTKETSYPKELLADEKGNGEVLASIARETKRWPEQGPDKQYLSEVLRALKGDALLKIAAPMLGTTFDSLKQRRKIYVLQRAAIASCAALFLTLLFSVYAVRQNQRVQEQLQKTYLNESRVLAARSADALEDGDRMEAIRLALAGLPKSSKGRERPLLTESMYALSNAAYAYAHENFRHFIPEYTLQMDMALKNSWGEISPDGSRCMAIDYSGKLYLFDLEQGLCEKTFIPSDLLPGISDTGFCGACFLSDEKILLFLSDHAVCLEPYSETVLWDTDLELLDESDPDVSRYYPSMDYIQMQYHPVSGQIFCYFYAQNRFHLSILEDSAGDLSQNVILDSDIYPYASFSEHPSTISVSPSGNQVLLGCSCMGYRHHENHFSLLLYQAKTDQFLSVDTEYPDVCNVCFLDEDHFAVLSTAQISNVYAYPVSRTYAVSCYSCEDVSHPIWTAYENSYSIDPVSCLFPGTRISEEESTLQDAVVSCFGNQVLAYDPADGTRLMNASLSSQFAFAEEVSPDRLLLIMQNGAVYRMDLEGNSFEMAEIQGSFSHAVFHTKQQGLKGRLLLFSDRNGTITVLNNLLQDETLHDLSVMDPLDIACYQSEGQSYRIILTSGQIIAFRTLEDMPLASVKVSENAKLLDIRSINGKPVLLYTSDFQLCGLDILNNELLYQKELPNPRNDSKNPWKFLGWRQNFCVLGDFSGNCFLMADLSDPSAEFSAFSYPETTERIPMLDSFGVMSPDGNTLAVRLHFINYDPDTYIGRADSTDRMLALYDLNTETWRFIGEELDFTDYWNYRTDFMEFSPDGSRLAVLSLGRIHILDPALGAVTQTVDVSCFESNCFHFYNDRFLILIGDSCHPTVWDLERKEQVFSDTSSIFATTELGIDPSGYVTAQNRGPNPMDQERTIYRMEADGSLTPFLSIVNGMMTYGAEEITCWYQDENDVWQTGWYPVYDLDGLLDRAHMLLRESASE